MAANENMRMLLRKKHIHQLTEFGCWNYEVEGYTTSRSIAKSFSNIISFPFSIQMFTSSVNRRNSHLEWWRLNNACGHRSN